MAHYIHPGTPPSVQTRSVVLEKFLGVDLTSSPVSVDKARSPDAPNMIPDEDGYPAKRAGYHTVLELGARIYGAYGLKLPEQSEKRLIHSGTKLYLTTAQEEEQTGTTREMAELLYEGMAERASCAVQLKEKLWILDGKTYLCYDGQTVRPVKEIATVPMITIAKGPKKDTGATSYLPVNLLTGKRTDSFAGTKDDADYFLSFDELTTDEVKVEILNSDGIWKEKKDGFTLDKTLGKVHFNTPPGESPVEGEDNVHITYEVESHAQRVDGCNCAVLYGVNGALDRVFVTGHPQYPNIDRWSAFEDPAYFADTDYSVLGSEGCAIVGYSMAAGKLAAHKDGEENGRNVFIRQGSLTSSGDAQFLICDVVQAENAVAPKSFYSAMGEPLFLTRRGVFALTDSEATGEKYAQNRSYFINGVLTREDGLEDACCAMWKQFYLLCIPKSRRIYLLDTEQKVYEPNEPQSSYQMECFVWEDVDAVHIWQEGTKLRFGTQDGAVREFWPGGKDFHYNDCRKLDADAGREDLIPVKARWSTPLMNLGTWANLKTVTGVWVVGQPFLRSGGQICYATDKTPEQMTKEYYIDIFDWNDVDFNRWTFQSMDRPTVVFSPRKAKKIKLFQVCVKNERLFEPFGIFAIHINYKVGSKVKR